jgi:excisionase family DNA binding protein
VTDPTTRKTISVPEAGRQLGLSRNGAYEAVKRGEIPVVRIGKRILVPADAIDRLLARAWRPITDEE